MKMEEAMLSKTKVLMTSSVLTVLLLLGTAGSALAEPSTLHSPHVAKQLAEFKQTVFEMQREAAVLSSMAPNRHLSWQSHVYRLDALKNRVNEIGKSLAELETQKPVATDGQALAIEHTRPHLVSVAQNLTQAIKLVNVDRNNVLWGEYGETVSDIYTHADAMHTKLDTILDFENARVRFDRLELQSVSDASRLTR